MDKFWDKIDQVSIYEPTLSKTNTKNTLKDSIFCYTSRDNEPKERTVFTAEFRFSKNDPKSDTVGLVALTPKDLLRSIAEVNSTYIRIPKKKLKAIFEYCLTTKTFLQENEDFMVYIDNVIDKLVQKMRSEDGIIAFNCSKNYSLSKGNGVLVGEGKETLGKFGGLILNKDTISIKNISIREGIDSRSKSNFVYKDHSNNIEVVIPAENLVNNASDNEETGNKEILDIEYGSYLKKYIDIHKIDPKKQVGINLGTIEEMESKNIYVAKNKFEHRFLNIRKTENVGLKEIVNNERTVKRISLLGE
jgi:hypothetical protein